MTLVEVISYVVVPLICLIGFPCIVMMIQFCFAINTKVTSLESDYRHLDRNMKQGLASVQTQLDILSKDVKAILKNMKIEDDG